MTGTYMNDPFRILIVRADFVNWNWFKKKWLEKDWESPYYSIDFISCFLTVRSHGKDTR